MYLKYKSKSAHYAVKMVSAIFALLSVAYM